ncbi:MAG: type II CAAX endopeptidase family protein [Candidatus Electryonea clarkiae]|nr:type II CAAX endopeptidase family protein [Candidatus Electryonea clarkiae]MDP8288656.1 type II CAAX endopeptidase family protein [Candidatus Electryonea clarkiae]
MNINNGLIEGQPRGGLPLIVSVLSVAAIVWFFLFAVKGTPFWTVIAIATFVLGSISIIVYPDTLRASLKTWLMHIALGLLVAGILYFIFYVGNIIVRLLPFGSSGVEAVYGTKSQASDRTILMLLLFPVGPGEELFWRGLVQRALSARLGPLKGFIIATLLYTAVHLPSMNITLIGAAAVGGIVWGLLYRKVKHIGPGIVSHAIWDAAVFVLFPFT